ncbi:MAG: site-2 protease family protein [Sandaracinaceae bacterium]
MPRLRVLGFPVRIRPIFLVVVGLLGVAGMRGQPGALADLGLWMVIVPLSILWHELGHAVAARAFGHRASIELYGLGGVTVWGGGEATTPWQRIVVSAAGPFAGLLLGTAVFLLQLPFGVDEASVVGRAVTLLLYANVLWSLVNLVPMLPWDGGLILAAGLDLVTRGRGLRAAGAVTVVLAGIATAASLYLAFQSPGWLWMAYLSGLSILAGWRALAYVRQAQAPPPSPAQTEEALRRTFAERVAAIVLGRSHPEWRRQAEQTEDLVEGMAPGPERASRLELLAWMHLLARDVDAAEAAAARLAPEFEPSPFLAAMLAYAAGRPDEAVAQLEGMASEEAPEAWRRALVAARVRAGDAPGAAAVVLEASDVDRLTLQLAATVLLEEGAFEEASRVAIEGWERFGEPLEAALAARARAKQGRPEEALTWLERAVEAGFEDGPALDRDEALDEVRGLPGWQELRRRV